MANQKTTDFRRLTSTQVSPGDLFGVVDVSEPTTPTGENKVITAADLLTYLVDNGFQPPPAPLVASAIPGNGLSFNCDPILTPPTTDARYYCQGVSPAIGSSDLSISVRACLPSIHNPSYQENEHRVIAGVLGGITNGLTSNSFFIGARGSDLVGTAVNGAGQVSDLVVPDFFSTYFDRLIHVIFSRDVATGQLRMWVDGAITSGSQTALATGSISPSLVVIGNGIGTGTATISNVDATVFGFSIRNVCVDTTADAQESFFRGEQSDDLSVIGNWNSKNLNPCPGQWLDSSVNGNHLTLPVQAAFSTNPGSTFKCQFYVDSSGYLGGNRDVLPDNYSLESIVVESDGSPLISIGTSNNIAPVSASITGSWRDNRVAMVNAAYGVNPLTILTLGDVHQEKTMYVEFYSSSMSPCTFSFNGYVR